MTNKTCENCVFHVTPREYEPCAGCLATFPKFVNWRPQDCGNEFCEVKGEDTCPDCEFKVKVIGGSTDYVTRSKAIITPEQNDQTAKADAGKPRLTLVPRQILYDIAKVREYGVNKYPEGGTENWRNVDVQRYRDAAFRHFLNYLDAPSGADEESGLSHLAHLACNISFLCEMEVMRNDI